MRYSFLSHEYSERIPLFGEEGKFVVSQLKSTASGDSSNSFSAEIQSHWGTHIDAPLHFFTNGQNITSYSAGHFVFVSPQVIQVALKPSEILSIPDVAVKIHRDSDLLLLKSGWGEFRSQPKYYRENPGINPDFARQLRSHCPTLRAVGIDWLSISAFQHRELGREAHRAFLNPDQSNPILLIEDMDMQPDLTELRRVIVAPLRIGAFDSAPCTVIGECG